MSQFESEARRHGEIPVITVHWLLERQLTAVNSAAICPVSSAEQSNGLLSYVSLV